MALKMLSGKTESLQLIIDEGKYTEVFAPYCCIALLFGVFSMLFVP